MKNKIAILGIVDVLVYTITVILYLIIKSDMLLTLWEVITIFSAPIMLLILLNISQSNDEAKPVLKNLIIIFMTCTIVLTSTAHFVNIAVTRKLIAEGLFIPTYLQIGYWPSVEMAIDYIAWGFFMGLAFITTAYCLSAKRKILKRQKIELSVCGILCQAGFWGTIFINENLWYLAPLGYGVGTIVLCVEMLQKPRQI